MNNRSLRWALWWIRRTCADPFLDELEGDLLELYAHESELLGQKRASRRFYWRSLTSLRWYRLRQLSTPQSTYMLQNHFKMAYRHALRHRSNTTIHLLGLVFGIAAALFIGLYIKNEFSHDRFHANGDDIYRVLQSDPATGERFRPTSSQHGQALKDAYPAIQLCRFGQDPVRIGEEQPLLIDDFYWTDSTFFDLFSFPLLRGNPQHCLSDVNSLVLTRSLSERLFGTTDVVGRIVRVKIYDGDQELRMKITGVAEDPPGHSHIQFAALGSMRNAEQLYGHLLEMWGFSWLHTYVRASGGQIDRLRSESTTLPDRYTDSENAYFPAYGFQPLHKVHLHSRDILRDTPKGNIRNVYIFGAIGLLILLIAQLNYVNLATARATTRSQEISVRKILGSQKQTIFAQFLAETLLFIFGAGAVALTLVVALLPRLNQLFKLDLSLSALSWLDGLYLFAGIGLLGVLTGLLPAFVMSRLNIHSSDVPHARAAVGRKAFIGVQFTITVVLLVGTLVVYQQYRHLQNYDLGFTADQLIHIPVNDRAVQANFGALKQEIARIPGVVGVSMTSEALPSTFNSMMPMDWSGSGWAAPKSVNAVGVDTNYFEIIGAPFMEGKGFSYGFDVDSAYSVVLNEAARNLISRKNLIGSEIEIEGRNRKVVGVVQNYHSTSLHSRPGPNAYFIFGPGRRASPDNLLVKIQSKELTQLLPNLEQTWANFSADPLAYAFVDESFAAAYEEEEQFSRLVSSFTLIAIVISLVGLFGLISFIAQLKLKEISIRRILGANQWSLLEVLGRDFLRVYLVTLFIALPAAYYLVSSWLQRYPYRIELDIWLFAAATLISLGISVGIIYFHLRRTLRQLVRL